AAGRGARVSPKRWASVAALGLALSGAAVSLPAAAAARPGGGQGFGSPSRPSSPSSPSRPSSPSWPSSPSYPSSASHPSGGGGGGGMLAFFIVVVFIIVFVVILSVILNVAREGLRQPSWSTASPRVPGPDPRFAPPARASGRPEYASVM